jgi:hypothetical protein
MPKFILLLHQEANRTAHLSPEEIQKIIGRYTAWRDDLVKRGKVLGGEKLTNDGGRHLRTKGDSVSVTEGPFSESQEVLGGFFLIESADYEEAAAIASTCPHMGDNRWIEVRQIDAMRG